MSPSSHMKTETDPVFETFRFAVIQNSKRQANYRKPVFLKLNGVFQKFRASTSSLHFHKYSLIRTPGVY
jgi:hypothetical protein